MRAREFIQEYIDTESLKFNTWFGDSKVVDENGEPLMVFHGTNEPKKIKHLYGWSHFGSSYAANQRIADKIQMDVDMGQDVSQLRSRVYPVYLSIQNPIQIDDSGEWHPFEMFESLQNRGIIPMDKHIEDYPEGLDAWLEAEGYDGIYYMNTFEDEGHKSWIPFSDSQIKLAIS